MNKLFLILFALIISLLSSTIINIPDDQSTIQQGIDVSIDGDTVLVQPGTYFENITLSGKNITLASYFLTSQDTSYISETIIDGSNSNCCVTFEDEEDSTAVLCGFTIRNGYGDGSFSIWYGGGLSIIDSSPTIQNCKIVENSNAIRGGGIAIWNNSSPRFNNCIISYNFDCGIYVNNSEVIFINALIFNNEYGLRCYGSNVLLMNCDIINNSGFGIKCLNNSNPVLINSIIWNNDTNITFFYGYNPNSISITHSDIQNGEAGIETNNNGTIYWLEGNIDEDPIVINIYEDNFHLMNNSPCIGSGVNQIQINDNWYYSPNIDIENNPRPTPTGSMIDMGAYENQYGEPQVSSDDFEFHDLNCGLNNFPNPFNPKTTIEFHVQNDSQISLSIYNIKGQKITTLVNKDYTKGNYSIIWNGGDEFNNSIDSGVYYYKLIVNGKTKAVEKCLLLK